MSTRTKLIICSYTSSILLLLNVFSKPLHIPEAFQWVLIIGVFIPLGLMFHFIKKQKQERLATASGDAAQQSAGESPKKIKNRLILLIVISVAIGLAAPLWMPLTGSTSTPTVHLVCGLVTAVIVCIIMGLRLRKL